MKRSVSLLLALLLCLCLLPAARAYHFPFCQGAVTDEYGVLSSRVSEDVAAYSERLTDEDGILLRVAAVLFLDGLEPNEYAEQLLTEWGLDASAAVLVIAAGEDKCGVALGTEAEEKLGSGPVNLLYTTDFAGKLAKRDYDGALNAYFAAFNGLKGLSGAVDLNGLFNTQTLPPQSARPTALPQEFFQIVRPDADEDLFVDEEIYERRVSRLTWIGIIALIVLIISQSDPVRKARRHRQYSWRSYGCGCSPLGWILGLFGLTALIDRILRNRDKD